MKTKLARYLFVYLSVTLFIVGCGEKEPESRIPDKITVEFKTVYPGVYDEAEKELFDITKEYLSGGPDELAAKLEAQLAGKTQIGDMKLNHALPPVEDHTPGIDYLVYRAKNIYPLNPFYTDPEYAEKTGYGGLIAAPFAVQPGFGFAYVPKGTDIWVSNDDPAAGRGLDHEFTFHKPIYPDDTLNGVLTEQSISDITDPDGSKVRKFRLTGRGEVYNQKDELVMSIFCSGIETFKIFKDRSMAEYYDRPLNIAVNKPDGYWDRIRDRHEYTEADWEYIKDLWSKEEIRGTEPLYWEDVKIGDEPTWTVDGPLVDGGRGTDHMIVREILMRENPDEIEEKLTRDSFGIYRLKEGVADSSSGGIGMPPGGRMGTPPGGRNGVPEGEMGMPPGGQAGPTPDTDIASDDPKVRSSFHNSIGRNYATRIITNWMGDEGWLHKFAWRLAFSMDVGRNQFPEDFDRPSYLLKVSYLKEQGKFMNTHGFDGDLAITKAYVCDKYIKDGNHYVDLVVWLETIDGYIWSECYAVVELPSRENNK